MAVSQQGHPLDSLSGSKQEPKPHASVVVKGLQKFYGSAAAVDNVNFEVQAGEFVTLLGPSGCGKTTTLRCIAGLETVNGGEIWINNQLVSSGRTFVAPEKRNIGMVFQSYAVWPHLSVFDNVAYGLVMRKVPASERADRVTRMVELVGLKGFEKRLATEMSGGQQQRVSLARALVVEPQLLLFDEPLSNLDAKLRERMRIEIRELQQRTGVTAIYVTHDQSEAMAVADRIILMRSGRIEQEGSSQEIYHTPRSKFVANFIGVANFLTGTVVGHGKRTRIRLAGDLEITSDRVPDEIRPGEKITLLIRPEHVEFLALPADENCWHLPVHQQLFLGEVVETYVKFAGETICVRHRPAQMLRESEVYMHIAPDNVQYIPEG